MRLRTIRRSVSSCVSPGPRVPMPMPPPAAGDALEVAPHPGQPRIGVLHLRQLDLQLGFVGLGTGGEDVEDQLRAVEDFDPLAAFGADFFVDEFFQPADLPGRKVVIEDDDVGLLSLCKLGDFDGLAAADVGAGVGLAAAAAGPGPTTFAPAVLASDASSPSGSRGSAVESGRITPTSTARSWRTDNSVRFSSANLG